MIELLRTALDTGTLGPLADVLLPDDIAVLGRLRGYADAGIAGADEAWRSMLIVAVAAADVPAGA